MNDSWNSSPEPIDSPPRGPGVARRFVHLVRELLETVLPAILIALLLNVFVGQATRVQGQSMEPNLHTDQRLVVEKVSYRFHGPRRGDIVVIRVPSQGDELLIKRVIGLPGETVEVRDGHVYIDEQLLDEPYTQGSTRSGRIARVIVPPLNIFVMGDNRDHSNDSRTFGPVPIENVVGRAWLSYWPLNDAGIVQ